MISILTRAGSGRGSSNESCVCLCVCCVCVVCVCVCVFRQVLVQASGSCGMRSVCVYGGVPKKEQVDALNRGVDIVVGTPGRLEDLMQEGVCKLSVSSVFLTLTPYVVVSSVLLTLTPYVVDSGRELYREPQGTLFQGTHIPACTVQPTFPRQRMV